MLLYSTGHPPQKNNFFAQYFMEFLPYFFFKLHNYLKNRVKPLLLELVLKFVYKCIPFLKGVFS